MDENLEPTCDTEVFIEEKYEGYVRYINTSGKRWEVFGTCNNCGKCWEGANGPKPILDCPITENFYFEECTLTVNIIN